ncbi:MAG: hypothetical protein PUC00_03820 [Clostridiales bacterium]|nr:hypothetical protein [Clostridiales bacterium]
MKTFKKAFSLLVFAAVSIAIWEAVQSFSYEQMNVSGLSSCKRVYVANQTKLNEALPALIALAGTNDSPQAVDNNLHAYVHGSSAENCAVVIPVRNVGDFYQNTYDFGLVWTTDVSRLAGKNPSIILVALADGWWAYASVRPQ